MIKTDISKQQIKKEIQNNKSKINAAINEIKNLEKQVQGKSNGIIPKKLKKISGYHSALLDSLQNISNFADQYKKKYEIIYNTAPVMLHSIDEKGKITNVSNYWLKKMGYKRSDVIGKKSTSFLTVESRRFAREKALPLFFKKGHIYNVPYQMVKKNGQIIDVLLSAITEYNAENSMIRSLAVMIDITEKNKAESALKESESKYRNILACSLDGFLILDIKGKIIEVNKAYIKIIGYSQNELLNMCIDDLKINSSNTEFTERIKKFVKKGYYNFETTHLTKDGNRVDFDVSVVLSKDKKFIYASLKNITERKQVENELTKKKLLLDKIREAQSLYIEGGNIKSVFKSLLKTLIEMTESEYGFLDEVVEQEDGSQYKLSLALSDISWDDSSKKLYKQLKQRNYKFEMLNNLAGLPVLRKSVILSTDALHDKRAGGLPEGHPLIKSYMGIPIYFGGKIMGVAGVANRKGGYSEEIAEFLEPFLSTCGSIIFAAKNEKLKTEKEIVLAEKEELLRAMLNAPSDSMWILLDKKGKILMTNEATAKRANKDVSNMIGTNVFDYFSPNISKRRKKYFIKIIRTSEPIQFEDSRNGRTINTNMYPVLNHKGKLEKVAVFSQDITERKEMELAILKNQKTLIHAQKVAKLGNFEWNVKENIFYCSQEVYNIFEIDSEFDLDFNTINSMVYPDDIDLKAALVKNIPADSNKAEMEFRIITKKGKIKYLYQTAEVKRDHKNNPVLIFGIMQDITIRKIAEQKLKQSEEQFKTIFENSLNAILLADDHGNYLAANQAAAKMFGYSVDQLTKMNVKDLRTTIPPVAAKRYQEYVKKGREIGEFDFVLPTGEKRIALYHASRVHDDFHISVLTDITERKNFERKLKESERKFFVIFNQSPVGITLIDLDSRKFFEVNRAFELLTGYKKSELIGKSPEELKLVIDQVQDNQLNKTLIEEGIVTKSVVKFKKKNKKTSWAILSAEQIYLDNRRFALSMMIDISERKKVELKLEKSHKQLRDLTVNIQKATENERAHIAREIHDDMGQALTVLKMDLHILKDRFAAEIPEFNNRIETLINFTNSIIKSVKRITSELRPTILDDMGLAAGIELLIEDLQKRSGMRCKLSIDPEELDIDNEISITIYRIVQESLTNILKHAEASQMSLNIQQNKNLIKLVISDNGIGMKKSGTIESKSFGILGMKERVLAVNGRIVFSDNAKKGTKIEIEIPLNSRKSRA